MYITQVDYDCCPLVTNNLYIHDISHSYPCTKRVTRELCM